MTEMSFDDPNDAPKAESVKGYKCPACEHLHIVLLDEEGRTLATAVISRDMLMGMLEKIDAPPGELEVLQ